LMADCTGGAGAAQGRRENSARPLVTPKPQHQKGGKQQTTKEPTDAKWHILIDGLNKIAGDLSKDKEGEKHQESIAELTRQVHDLWTQANQKENPAQKQLSRIEEKLDNLTVGGGSMNQTQLNIRGGRSSLNQTWAGVAAQGIRQIVEPLSQRPAVRVRLPDSKGKSPTELLATVKPLIAGAYAVKQLRSGDIEVAVPDQRTKDRVLNQPQVENLRILRQDYPVELWGVPLTTPIDTGKSANNTALMQGMCAASRAIIPTLSINKIRWLHTPKQHESHLQMGKTRGTVVVSLPTQALQHEVIQKGIVINSQLYDTHLHDHGTQIRQCFNCGQWGHTQSACGKTAKCSICADTHQTMDCPKKKVSCVNCGQAHKAWQKAVCKTFKSFLATCQEKRGALATKTAAIRSRFTTTTQLPPQSDGFRVVQPRKRGRSPGAAPTTTKRGPGRPRGISTAAQDPSQAKLFAQAPTSSGQTSHLSQGEVVTDPMEEDAVEPEPSSC
jgi:hypothetical protein